MGFSSQAGQVILKTQETKGVLSPSLPAGVGIKLRSGSLGPTRELMIPDAEIGGGRDVVDAQLGAGAFQGDYEFYVRFQSLLTLLNACLGSTSSADDTTGATGIGTHTVSASDASSLPCLSIEERIGAGLECYNYTDVYVNTLHLEAEANGYLMGTAGLVGARQVAGATFTADPNWDDTPLTVGTNITITYGGISLPAKSFSLDINNNIESDYFRLGSLYLADLTPKRREVTASFNIRAASSAMWRQAVYGAAAATQMGGTTTKQQLVITMSTYEAIPDSDPAVPYSLELTFPKYTLKPHSFSASGDDIIENDVEGQALRPNSSLPTISATLTNDLAGVI